LKNNFFNICSKSQDYLTTLPPTRFTTIALPPADGGSNAVETFLTQCFDVSLKLEPRGVEAKADLAAGEKLFPDPRLCKARQVVFTNPARSAVNPSDLVRWGEGYEKTAT